MLSHLVPLHLVQLPLQRGKVGGVGRPVLARLCSGQLLLQDADAHLGIPQLL